MADNIDHVDLTRRRGDTFADAFVVTSETTGAVIDITGYSFLLTVDPSRAPTDSLNNIFQLTGTITDAVNGLVEFAPNATQADQPESYFYDVQMTDTAGKIRTIAEGRYNFVQDITK